MIQLLTLMIEVFPLGEESKGTKATKQLDLKKHQDKA
jgi:hypothetical protein